MKASIKNESLLTHIPMPKKVDLRGKLSLSFSKCLPRKLAKLIAMQALWPKIHSADRCLDIGTSNGGFSYYYTQSGNWTFLDNNGDYFLTAKNILKGNFVVEDLTTHLQSHNGYHFIAFIDTITYFPDPGSILKSLCNNLSENGSLIVSGIEKSDSDILMRLRKLLGIEDALGILCNPNSKEMKKLLQDAGFSTVTEKKYFGPFGQLFQTFIDCFFIQKGEQGNRLTVDLSKQNTSLRVMLVLTPFCYIFSMLVTFLDRVLPFLPRYAYVIVAQKRS